MKNLLRLLLAVFYFLPTAAIAADDTMVSIPAGCFQMGTDAVFEYEVGRKNDRERPVHKVCVNAFHLDKHEVTQKQWEDVMGVKINIHQTPHHGDNLPVDFAKWEQATEYCAKRGARLPTEAEWEYAARAGSKGLLPWGEEIDGDYLWYVGNAVRRPHPVGTRKPNDWGLHDMLGSVWEWVADWYLEHYYAISPRNNPRGPKTGSWRVIRGASWRDDEKDIRVTVRRRGQADATVDYSVGFRCARDAAKTQSGK
ncbi:MAG: formylglycine-generating enzyme family protein [Nitrospinales bacterium]